MTSLSFAVVGARAEPYAAGPTVTLRLRLTAAEGARVAAVALTGQVRIEPQRRQYDTGEAERLHELFGDAPQWAESLRPFLWTHVGAVVPGFDGSTAVDVPIACTYDLDVSGAKYLNALGTGDVPLLLLFSGTVFSPSGTTSFTTTPIAWHEEARFGLPIDVWREAMDRHFPNSAWIRIGRDTHDALNRFRAGRALPTWDRAFEQLLEEAGEP